MAGYKGYSMSNNAVAAYNNGEKPMSKWTKTEILEEIKKQDVELKCSFDKLKKVPAKILKEKVLYNSSWHHTSKHYNKTNFYSLDISAIENLTDAAIDKLMEAGTIKEVEPEEQKWECAFLEWSGTKKHPKATEIIEIGIVKGSWFYRQNGTKKSTTAKGFKFIKKVV